MLAQKNDPAHINAAVKTQVVIEKCRKCDTLFIKVSARCAETEKSNGGKYCG